MARGKSSAMTFTNPYSQNANGNAETPEISGGGLFFSFDEVQSAHLSGVSEWPETPNSKEAPIMGGPASGEENPFSVGTKNK